MNNETKTHCYFMEKAIEVAISGMRNRLGVPFGAVIVKNKEIIVTNSNQVILKNAQPTPGWRPSGYPAGN